MISCNYYLSGSPTQLTSANISANSGSHGASAFSTEKHFKLVLTFCDVRVNTQANCIFFWVIKSDNISCLGLFNNSCQSADYPGLVYVYAILSVSNCVFLGNTFDWFLGTQDG
jgi:hypothetical protein